MGKVVDANEKLAIKKAYEETPVITASAYFMTFTDENGKPYRYEITGEELISTVCPVCKKEHHIDSETFYRIALEDGIYGTSVYCAECTQKRMATRE